MHQIRFPLGLCSRPAGREGKGKERGAEGKGRIRGKGKEEKRMGGIGKGGRRREGRRGEGICRTNVKLLPTRLISTDQILYP